MGKNTSIKHKNQKQHQRKVAPARAVNVRQNTSTHFSFMVEKAGDKVNFAPPGFFDESWPRRLSYVKIQPIGEFVLEIAIYHNFELVALSKICAASSNARIIMLKTPKTVERTTGDWQLAIASQGEGLMTIEICWTYSENYKVTPTNSVPIPSDSTNLRHSLTQFLETEI